MLSLGIKLFLVALLALCLALSLSPSQASAASPTSYKDCESCVAAGFGWSLEKELCGKQFKNKECPEAEEEAEEEEDEDESEEEGEEEEEDDDDQISVDDAPRTYNWADTELLTHIWSIVSKGDLAAVQALLERDPGAIHERSKDGRGALFWAYEYNQPSLIEYLIDAGADTTAKDANGETPADLAGRSAHDL